jgi:hypothetical protein
MLRYWRRNLAIFGEVATLAITTVTEVPPAPSSTTTSSHEPTAVTLSTVAPTVLPATGWGQLTATTTVVSLGLPAGPPADFNF